MSTRALAGATALLLTTAPAWALTPEELWADWRETFEGLGTTIAAREAREGDALVLTDVTLTFATGSSSTETVYERVTLLPDGDGAVIVELPAEMSVVSRSVVDGESVEQGGTLSQEGQDIRVSEADGVRTYDWRADRLAYVSEGIQADPEEPPVDLRLALSDIASVQRFTEAAEGFAVDGSLEAGSVAFDVSTSEGPAPFALSYVATALAGEGGGTVTPAAGGAAASPLTGLDLAFAYRHAGATTTAEGKGGDGPFAFAATSTSGTVEIAIDPDGLTERFGSKGLEMQLQLARFPLPVTASMASFGTGFTAPLGVSEETKPFALQLSLTDLEIDDVIWSLFDPTGQLPRDPASLALDVSGEALMRADLFDPEAIARLGGAPGEVETLSLNRLSLDALGATLGAVGELTFPTSDIAMPVGTIEIALDGAYALSDRLVALGLLPAEQVAFIRGLSGMVARQVGEDQLESTITFTEGGGISANGLTLR